MQLSYTNELAIGLPGGRADSGPADIHSKVNPDVAIPFGVAVCAGTDPDREVKLPTTAAEAAACLGVALRTQAMESSSSGDPQYPVKSSVNVLTKGRVFVKVTEAVNAGDPVFVRFADGEADENDTQKGSFGKSADGDEKQLHTLTPTAANSTNYNVSIFKGGLLLKTAQVTSDGSAEAGEIVTALKTALGTVPGVTLGGTDTLTITADAEGDEFSVEASPNIAIALTTATVPTAAELKGAVYRTSAAADGLAVLELNLPA